MSAGLNESARRALRAFSREVIRFQIDYPLDVVTGAERETSLRYHIYSTQLFLEDLVFDPQGVPKKNYRLLGPQYNPLFVAWWGLHHLECAARMQSSHHFGIFLAQLNWLRTNAVVRNDGSVVWPCRFDWQEGQARLRAPWISAMYQGIVISALVRGFRLTRDEKLLDLATAGTRVFLLAVDEGGVRTYEGRRVLYEEYPAFPLPRILDGFLFSLLGLYDLFAQTGNKEVYRLFMEGLEGLTYHLSWWNYRGKWSWYGSHGYLCPPHYHALNRALLTILHRLTGKDELRRVAEGWAPSNLSQWDRLEIFMVFALAKNCARIRLPNEKGT